MPTEEQLRAMNIVGKRIRLARKAARLSIEKAAEYADCNARFLGEIERGRKRPSLPMILALAEAVRTSPAFFFKLDEDDSPLVMTERVRILVGRCNAQQLRTAYRLIQSILLP